MILIGNKETEIKEIEKINVERGDLLLVTTSSYATGSRMEKIKNCLVNVFKGKGINILIIRDDTKIQRVTNKQLRKLGLKRI